MVAVSATDHVIARMAEIARAMVGQSEDAWQTLGPAGSTAPVVKTLEYPEMRRFFATDDARRV